MKKLMNIILIGIVFTSFQKKDAIIIDKEEAQKAYHYLMQVRKNPENYYKELKFPKNTKTSSIQLQWNDILAKVAEERAYDMAKRNYFSHVNPDKIAVNYLLQQAGYQLEKEWYKSKRDNFFESIYVTTEQDEDGIEGIRTLILDEGTSDKGHRNHLLGIDEWNRSLVDVGIGIARSSKNEYKTYMVVIIAKHSW